MCVHVAHHNNSDTQAQKEGIDLQQTTQTGNGNRQEDDESMSAPAQSQPCEPSSDETTGL